MTELGREASSAGVAAWYRELVSTLIIDEVDRGEAEAVEAEGVDAVVTATVMSSPAVTEALAHSCLDPS
jgi:2-phospho-L-lactate transferase/gluconeogenesis factor (CofD/UPF0052 family)